MALRYGDGGAQGSCLCGTTVLAVYGLCWAVPPGRAIILLESNLGFSQLRDMLEDVNGDKRKVRFGVLAYGEVVWDMAGRQEGRKGGGGGKGCIYATNAAAVYPSQEQIRGIPRAACRSRNERWA